MDCNRTDWTKVIKQDMECELDAEIEYQKRKDDYAIKQTCDIISEITLEVLVDIELDKTPTPEQGYALPPFMYINHNHITPFKDLVQDSLTEIEERNKKYNANILT